MGKIQTAAKIQMNIEEVFYYLFFGILLMAKGIGLYDGMKAFRVCMFAALACWAVKMLLTEHTVRELAVIAAGVALGGMVYISSGEKAALIYILVIVGMKHVPVKRVFIVGTAVWSAAFFSTVLLGLLKKIPDVALVHSKLGMGHIIRWSLGYPHPNVLHISYVILLAFFFYLVKLNKKQLIAATVLLYIGNFYIFLYSVSYTGLILTTVYLAFHLYFSLRKDFSKVERILMQCVLPACAGLSILGPVFIKGRLFDLLNKMMNTRWNLSRYFLTEQKISLFGTRMVNLPDKDYNIDCSYVYAFMYYGILLFAVIMLLYFFTIRWEVKKNKRKELAIMMAFLVAGMSEPFMFNLSFKNLTLIFAGEFLYSLPGGLKKADQGFWSKPVRFLPWAGYEVTIPNRIGRTWMVYLKECFIKYRLIILAAALAGMAVAGGLYSLYGKEPDRVYVDVRMSDYWPDEPIRPDSKELPADFNGLIIGNADGGTPMYELTGNIVRLEKLRGTVSAAVWGAFGAALAVYCAATVFGSIRRRRTDESIDGK